MTKWEVKLRADNGTYPRLIVSADTREQAIKAACNIELAPLRSVKSVAEYGNDPDMINENAINEYCAACNAEPLEDCREWCLSRTN